MTKELDQIKLHQLLSKFLQEGVRSNVWELLIKRCMKDIQEMVDELVCP